MAGARHGGLLGVPEQFGDQGWLLLWQYGSAPTAGARCLRAEGGCVREKDTQQGSQEGSGSRADGTVGHRKLRRISEGFLKEAVWLAGSGQAELSLVRGTGGK